eukprot:EG_transcript_7964
MTTGCCLKGNDSHRSISKESSCVFFLSSTELKIEEDLGKVLLGWIIFFKQQKQLHGFDSCPSEFTNGGFCSCELGACPTAVRLVHSKAKVKQPPLPLIPLPMLFLFCLRFPKA